MPCRGSRRSSGSRSSAGEGAGLATPVKLKRIAVPAEESLGVDQTVDPGPCAVAMGETDQQLAVSEP